MTLAEGFDALLALLLIGVAVWTVAARGGLAAVVGFVAFGLLLGIAWVRLGATDVALTEAAIGGGVTGVVLLGAAIRHRETGASAEGVARSPTVRIAAALLCALVAAGLAALVCLPPDPAPSLAEPAMAHLAATAVGNPITAVMMAYRAIDTLLESMVVLLALVAVWSLTPDRAWPGRPGEAPRPDRDGVLGFLARMLVPLGLVVAIHIVLVGADEPGGKFQGATILAAMWILLVLAGLADWPALGGRGLRLALVIGPAVFLAIGLLGFVWAGAFLAYPAAITKPLLLVIEAALTVSVATALALLAAGPGRRAAE
jgi:uncharacterized MnhB-related membrane protein